MGGQRWARSPLVVLALCSLCLLLCFFVAVCVVDAQSFCPSSFTVVCMLLLGVVLFALRFGLDLATFVGVSVLFGVVELDLAVFVGVCTSLVVRLDTAVWSVAGCHAIACRQDYM